MKKQTATKEETVLTLDEKRELIHQILQADWRTALTKLCGENPEEFERVKLNDIIIGYTNSKHGYLSGKREQSANTIAPHYYFLEEEHIEEMIKFFRSGCRKQL